jgi:O-antigen/teichoic acid export membrane protein
MWYLLSNASNVLAGMLSLPITARMVTKEQFGILGFFEPLTAIWTALLKFGFQHSILRLYTSSCLGQPQDKRNAFFATLLWVPQACSVAVTLLCFLVLCAVRHFISIPHFGLLLALLFCAQSETSISFCQTFLGAQRLTKIVAGFTTLMRWSATVAVVATVVFVSPTATALQWSRGLATAAVGVFILRTVAQRSAPSVTAFSRPLLGEAVRYGVPMSLTEVSSIVHDQLDRLLLAYYLGYVELGVYHLNYSVAQYLGAVMASSFNPAFAPYANHLYDQCGPMEYRQRIAAIVHPLLYVTAAILAGICAFAPDVVPLFIGTDKARPDLFVIIAFTYALAPLAGTLTYGLALRKKAGVLLGSLVASCVVNLCVNVLLIPRMGLTGAAYATAASFCALWITRLAVTPRGTIPVDRLTSLLRPALIALAAYAVTMGVRAQFGLPMLRIASGGLCFGVVFCSLTLLLDPRIVDSLQMTIVRNVEHRRETPQPRSAVAGI